MPASGGVVETRGRRWRPVHDQRRTMPAPVRCILGLLNGSDFIDLTVDESAADQTIGLPDRSG